MPEELEVLVLDVAEPFWIRWDTVCGEESVEIPGSESVETELDLGWSQTGEKARFEIDLEVQKEVETPPGLLSRQLPKAPGGRVDPPDPGGQ